MDGYVEKHGPGCYANRRRDGFVYGNDYCLKVAHGWLCRKARCWLLCQRKLLRATVHCKRSLNDLNRFARTDGDADSSRQLSNCSFE